jgi:hypothetical protein
LRNSSPSSVPAESPRRTAIRPCARRSPGDGRCARTGCGRQPQAPAAALVVHAAGRPPVHAYEDRRAPIFRARRPVARRAASDAGARPASADRADDGGS